MEGLHRDVDIKQRGGKWFGHSVMVGVGIIEECDFKPWRLKWYLLNIIESV